MFQIIFLTIPQMQNIAITAKMTLFELQNFVTFHTATFFENAPMMTNTK